MTTTPAAARGVALGGEYARPLAYGQTTGPRDAAVALAGVGPSGVPNRSQVGTPRPSTTACTSEAS